MRYAAAAEKISIACQWDASEGFLLWGRTKDGAYWPPLELKANLFAWHKASFYGTFIPEAAKPGYRGIKLSPVTALDFFAEPPRSEFLFLQWSDEILQLHKTTPLIRELLIQGKWLPDYDRWREGKTGWRLMLPPDFEPPAGLSYLAKWVDAAINELLEQNTGVNQAWQQFYRAVIRELDKPV
jgi:hypothetical protein